MVRKYSIGNDGCTMHMFSENKLERTCYKDAV